VDRISDLVDGREVRASGMRRETDRCRDALEAASEGRRVALVSSGDPGVYGMAGLILELRAAAGLDVPVEIIPGVTAANTAAARAGAPLMLDYAVISLSDLLVPREAILRRLEAVVAADLVVALYNPRSHTRTEPWEGALELLRARRAPETPVAVSWAMGGEDERTVVTTLADLPEQPVDMRSVVLVGNSTSRVIDGRFVTPRGYRL